ncbi:hypothetical protein VDGE_04656 [Verticillium dahliae]|uniref:Methyltransferase type 11 domain-containing protein n=2 Tax=Verticillium TaxID=1036719 RepID=A0A444S677_VERDA|nr:hypothetical protein VDGE_04656 [Verticillium dahliae]
MEPSSGQSLDHDFTESPMEVRVAQSIELPKTQAHAVTIYPELDRYRGIALRPPVLSDCSGLEVPFKLSTQDLPPPTPAFSGTSSQLSAFSGSPCTRFSESPGPGPYSRDTTPTSMSSQSPSLMSPARFPLQKPRQLSPVWTRPPVTRRRGSTTNEVDVISADPQGLAAVRESLTSSSSNSTVREVEKKEKEKIKKKRLSPMPPSPPPRKSSQKHQEERVAIEASPRRQRQLVRPDGASRSPSKSPALASRSTPTARETPPLRPSRDGTPDLQSQLFGPLPIIHSNLSSASLVAERLGYEDRAGPSATRKTAVSPLPGSSEAPTRLVGREATPAPRPATASPVKSERNTQARTPSPNTNTFNGRFAFFGRRAKTTPDIAQTDTKDKPTRKGPAAGTGHEGYGRLGAPRRRSGGALYMNRAIAGSGTSQESLNSTTHVDPFLRERMNPVVISGGEIKDNRNTSSDLSRTESNQSLTMSRPSIESRGGSEVSTTSTAGRTAMWASGLPSNPKAGFSHRRPSDSSDSEALAMKSTLAFRRSTQRLRSSPEQGPLRLPKPIKTTRAPSPSITSIDTSVVSDDSRFDFIDHASRGRTVTSTVAAPKKLTKRARSPRKWNIFSRSHKTSEKKEPEPVAATVKVVQQKPEAFYFMMDGSEQEEGVPTVEDVLRDAHVFDDLTNVPTPPMVATRKRYPTDPLPPQASALQIRRVDKKFTDKPQDVTSSQQDVLAARSTPARPSRLPQVGRIPRVINTRPEPPSPRSFSRPFKRVSYQEQPHATFVDLSSIAKGPSPPNTSTPELSHEVSTTTSTDSAPGRTSRDSPPEMIQIGHEFLKFSPNKKYQQRDSTSSSCSGTYVMAATAIAVPDTTGLGEDDIWDEYNDLLGDVPPSATSSKGVPFHLENYAPREIKLLKKNSQILESPTLALPSAKSIRSVTEEADRFAVESSVYSADMTERIKAAFAPKPEETPPQPLAASDTALRRSGEGSRRPSLTSQQRNSNLSRKSTGSSCKSSEDESPLSQVNLRVGSMTVSKWLSFGHVLFSPVRDELVPEVGSLKRPSILVIDGLGNDDWSFYAAETYPAATFFNMSPRAPLPTEHKAASTFPLSPPNHHQIQYTSHADKFPFGAESFTSVVYRFPAAGPESHYRNIMSEARRVLKPGGYIELSVLDVDLNNMGNRARRTVRNLKERIHEKTPETSLGSSSDLMLRLLGQQGFTDVKTCHVGVPVASVVARAHDGKKSPASGPKKPKDQRSLAEMMNDKSDAADENITKMVAKVGRWWYTRCYESAVGSTTARKTIWADRALLSECEEWRTSLKLLVCYASVPGKGRVASI